MSSSSPAPGRLIRTGLRWKIALMTAAAAALVATILGGRLAVQMRELARTELEKRGDAVARQLASNVAFETFSKDTVGLTAAAEATVREVPDVAWVIIRGPSGEVLAEARAQDLPKLGIAAPAAQSARRELRLGNEDYLDFSAPISVNERNQGAEADLDPLNLLGNTAPPGQTPAQAVGVAAVGFRLRPLQQTLSNIAWSAGGLALLVLLGCVAATMLITRILTNPLEKLAAAALRVGQGDLRQAVPVQSNDEIGAVADSFTQMVGTLRHLLVDLQAAAQDIDREAATVLATSTQQSALASSQSSAISETSVTVTEIAETSRQSIEQADSVIKMTQRSEELSRDGQRAVEESVRAMEMLGEQVREIALSITDLSERALQIGDIMSTVKDLAEQSNILALNASIEAAKAGEQGRGFGVVALEMRNLAEQSKQAATQVRAIVSEVQKGTRAAVAATEEGSKRALATMALTRGAGSSILGLTEVVKDSSAAARAIVGNTRHQTVGVEQILSAITQLSGSMSETLTGTRGIEQVAGSLTTLSRRLSELTRRYQV